MNDTNRTQRVLFACLLLCAITIAAYSPVFRADFVNYDDGEYVTGNKHVKQGLTAEGVGWAFTTGHMGSWHPLTWLSHMLDVQAFDLNPTAHHATNLIFHVLNSLLLFLLLYRTTGSIWRSAFAAGIFALHPLRVESVAWVSERKDVLSGFFGLCSLIFYARYATRSQGRPEPRLSYWLALMFLVLGLMSKPMLVTWPALMLVMDWWPLRRSEFASGKCRLLLFEKLPFIAVALAASVATFLTQRGSGAVISLEDRPVLLRVQNALSSCWEYLSDFFWPSGLAAFYPYPKILPPLLIAFCAALLIVITIIAVKRRKQNPYLIAGWLWFLISLLPVIGLVQVGYQARADRYMYLPAIGIGLAVVWWIGDLASRLPKLRTEIAASGMAALAVFAFLTNRQSEYWKSSEALFLHALDVTTDNFIAHQNLGDLLLRRGEIDPSFDHFQQALRINPRIPEVRNNVAVIYLRRGQNAEAAAEFAQVLKERPDFVLAKFNLAQALERTGKLSEAVVSYQEYVAAQPFDVEAAVILAGCLTSANRRSEALTELRRINQVQPKNFAGHFNAATLLESDGQWRDALAEYELARQAAPDTPSVLNNLAWILATHFDAGVRDGARAVKLGEHACELTQFKEPIFIGTLAAAYAEAGRFDDAVKTAEKARDVARAVGLMPVALKNGELMELYQSGKPFRMPAPQ